MYKKPYTIDNRKLQTSWLDGELCRTIPTQTVHWMSKLGVCGTWWAQCQNNAHSACRLCPGGVCPAQCCVRTSPCLDSSAAAEVKDQGGGLEGAGVVWRARSSSDLTSKWHIRGIIYHRQRHRKMYFEGKKNKKRKKSAAVVHTGLPWMPS